MPRARARCRSGVPARSRLRISPAVVSNTQSPAHQSNVGAKGCSGPLRSTCMHSASPAGPELDTVDTEVRVICRGDDAQ